MDKISIKLLEVDYLVHFPNMKDTWDIEALKTVFSNGVYGSMLKANSVQSMQALDLVDAAATFFVLIPELEAKIGSFDKIDLKTGLELSYQYKTVFYPWYDGLLKQINKEIEQSAAKLQDVKSKIEQISNQ